MTAEIVFRVIPRATRSEIVASMEGSWKVRLTSPPVEGAANAELVALLAKTFRVSKSAVSIISGAAARTKRVRIDGVDQASAESLLKAKTGA